MKLKKQLFSVLVIVSCFVSANRYSYANIPASESNKYLETFARLYGYVRYFHPSDESANTDWNKFLLYGVDKVRKCQSQKELKQTLKDLFLPIAPSIAIDDSASLPLFDLKSITPLNLKDYKPTCWQHLGVEGEFNSETYKSQRVGRQSAVRRTCMSYKSITKKLDARKYQGKKFMITASTKAQINTPESYGSIYFRVDKFDGNVGFFENSRLKDPVITNIWNTHTISGTIDNDAKALCMGGFLDGSGTAYFDEFKLYIEEAGIFREVELENPGFESEEKFKGWENGIGVGECGKSMAYNARIGLDVNFKNKCLIIQSGFSSAPLFREQPKIGECIRKNIGNGLFCNIPLALYANVESTYPKSSTYLKFKENYEGKMAGFIADTVNKNIADVIITWNIFQHFYPYFDNIKADWQQALSDALLNANKENSDIVLLLKKMTAQLNDGHITIEKSVDERETYFPPIQWDWIENNLVITKVLGKDVGLKPGDIILKIDNKNAKDYIEENERLVSASTPWHKKLIALKEILKGKQNSSISLTINDAVKKENKVSLVRNMENYAYRKQLKETEPYIKKIKKDVWYINLTRVPENVIDSLLPELVNAKSIICDLRGYPKNNDTFLKYLLKQKDTVQCWIKVPKTIYPDRKLNPGYNCEGWAYEPKQPHIKAKIIFITDANAYSYSESYLSFAEHYKLGTIIGQPTAGINGGINELYLNCGYTISWTGMKVVKQDGSQLFGVGIVPSVLVNKTINGVKAGKDEQFEKALLLAN